MAVKITDGFPEDLMKLLESLATTWGNAFDPNALAADRLTGGMTNQIYRVSWPANSGEILRRTVLVRLYGEGVEHFFDRDDEIRAFECLSGYGHGPMLWGKFREGRVEEFLHARTLSASDLREPEIASLIAVKMRDFHRIDMPGPKNVILWKRLRKWLDVAKEFCTPEDAKEYRLDGLENEIGLLESTISGHGKEVIGFCHNDLQYGNIMIEDEKKTITLIDYEYASYNPIAYDIANHFCEMAADYHTDTPHVLDYNKYPDLEERRRFIRQYLSSAGKEPDDTAIDQLEDDVNKYTLVNHVFWGLWGLISAYVNHIDFDYKEYARQRFKQYWSRKSEVLDVHEEECPNGVV